MVETAPMTFFSECPYTERGEIAPPHVVEAFWSRVFSEERNRIAGERIAAATAAHRPPTVPHAVGPLGPSIEPDKEELPDVVRRPVELVNPPGETDPLRLDRLHAERQAFFGYTGRVLISSGLVWTRRVLAHMGYAKSERDEIIKKARRQIYEDAETTDIEELRALSMARYDEIFRKAGDASDYRTQVRAQNSFDRVAGLVQEEATGALQEFAALTRRLGRGEQQIVQIASRAVDVEAEVVETDEESAA